MNSIKFLIIILVFTFSFSFAQSEWSKNKITNDTSFTIRINPNLPMLYIRYQDYFEPFDINEPQYGDTHFKVEIRKNKNDAPFQVINSVSEAFGGPLAYDYGSDDLGIEGMAVDINFDGYTDLRFKFGEGASSFVVNQSYEYYTFNPSTYKFEMNEELGIIPNPTPFPKEKIVRSYCRNSFAGTDGTIDEYKWNKNKLVLLRSFNYAVIMGTCNSDTDCKFTRTIEYYKNDKVIKTETKIINITDIPKYHFLYW